MALFKYFHEERLNLYSLIPKTHEAKMIHQLQDFHKSLQK